MDSQNYLKSFFKSFNIIHLVIIALFVMGGCFLSINVKTLVSDFLNPTALGYTLKGLCVIVLGVIAIGYLTKIRDQKINLFDLLAIANLLGILLNLIYTLFANKYEGYSVILSGIALIYLVGIALRSFLAHPQPIKNQFNCYIYSLRAKINPFIFAFLGVFLGIYISTYFNFNGKLYQNINNYFYAILLGIILLAVILMIVSPSKITLIDYLMITIVVMLSVMVIYANDDTSNYPLEHFVFLCLVGAFSLYFRGLGYTGSTDENNKYCTAVVDKYDYALIALCSVLCLIIAIMPVCAPLAFNLIIDKVTGTSFNVLDYKLVFAIIGLCIIIPFVLIIAIRGLKNKNILVIDAFLMSLEIISLLGIPLTYKLITNFNGLTTYALVYACIIVVLQVATIIIHIIRVKSFEASKETVFETDSLNLPSEEEVITESSSLINSDEEKEEAPEELPQIDDAEIEETLEEAMTETEEETNNIETIEARSIEEPEETEEEIEEDDVEELDEDDKEEQTAPSQLVISEQRIRLSFEEKTTLASDEVKNYYNEVKNYLLMYRTHARLSKKCESFRYKGLLAKVAFAGKTLKVNLAIDPQTLVGTKYFFKDTSLKKQYQLVPTQIKIKSERGLKYFKELVDMMMVQRNVKPKRKFEPTDYTSNLIPDGHAVLYSLGVTKDHLVDTMNVLDVPNDLPIDLVYHIPTVEVALVSGMKEENSIYLDTLCKHFEDGDVITLEKLKESNILTRGNMLRIKARGILDKHFTIYADSFEANALAMLLCTGSKAIKLVRKNND